MESVIQKFKVLWLKNCALNLPKIMEQGARENLTTLQAIDRLLEIEIESRKRARIALRFTQSKLENPPLINLIFPIMNHAKSRRG